MSFFELLLWLSLQVANPQPTVSRDSDNNIIIDVELKAGYVYCLQQSYDLETWELTSLGCVNGVDGPGSVTLYPNGAKQRYFRILWGFPAQSAAGRRGDLD